MRSLDEVLTEGSKHRLCPTCPACGKRCQSDARHSHVSPLDRAAGILSRCELQYRLTGKVTQ